RSIRASRTRPAAAPDSQAGPRRRVFVSQYWASAGIAYREVVAFGYRVADFVSERDQFSPCPVPRQPAALVRALARTSDLAAPAIWSVQGPDSAVGPAYPRARRTARMTRTAAMITSRTCHTLGLAR